MWSQGLFNRLLACLLLLLLLLLLKHVAHPWPLKGGVKPRQGKPSSVIKSNIGLALMLCNINFDGAPDAMGSPHNKLGKDALLCVQMDLFGYFCIISSLLDLRWCPEPCIAEETLWPN